MHQRTIEIEAVDLAGLGTPTIEIAVTEAGVGGRPLLLLHGFTGTRGDFDDWYDELASLGWHVVGPDHRGHGDSAKPADERAYAVELFAADALEVADALGWGRFVLLGHSMGGMVAQELAAMAPERLDGLVLMDTSYRSVPVDPNLLALGVELARTGGMPAVADAVAALGDDGPLVTEADRRLRAERPDWAARGDRNLRACAAEMYAAMLPAIGGELDTYDRLLGIRTPTLVMVGALDELFVEPSRHMAEVLPDARLAVLPDGGHSPQVEAPDAWRDALVAFLDEIAAAAPA